MNLKQVLVLGLATSLPLGGRGLAQSEFYLTFRGTSYQTNGQGVIVGRPVTERTWLQKAADAGGVTDLKTLALVYHVQGSVFGDTIDVVNPATGAPYVTLFGFYFGEDPGLGRIALTNDFGTQVRRVDQVYTSQSAYALGSAFLTKRFQTDRRGNVTAFINADLHYLVRSEGNSPAQMVIGTFTATKPFVPRP